MRPLKDLCASITDGEHGTINDDSSGKYYLLSNKNLLNNSVVISIDDRKINEETFKKINKRVRLQPLSILMSTVGTVGKISIVSEENLNYVFQRSVAVINVNPNLLDPYYLMALLESAPYQKFLKDNATGSIQKCLFISTIENIPIASIPITKQQEIGSKFKHINSLIKKNNEIINELTNKIKDQYSFYISNCSDEIQKVKLSDLLEEDNEKIDSNSNKLLIDLAAMPSSSLVIYNYGDSNKLTTNKTILKKGNILIGLIRPYLKKCLISPIDGVTTGTIGQFKIKDEKLQDFIVGIVTSDSFTNYLISVSTGTKMPVIKTSDILNYQISVDQSLLRKCNFTKTVNEIIVLNNENYKLTMLKSDYLNKLFN